MRAYVGSSRETGFSDVKLVSAFLCGGGKKVGISQMGESDVIGAVGLDVLGPVESDMMRVFVCQTVLLVR